MLTQPLLPILDPAILGWQPDVALEAARRLWPEQLLLRTREMPETIEAQWLAHFESHYPGLLICNSRLALTPTRTATLRHYPEGTLPPTNIRPFGVSAHSLPAVQRACSLGAYWILLSPIRATASHPQTQPMADTVRAACLTVAREAHVAVYGLGGLGPDDLASAQRAGLAGVAGIRRFFSSPSAVRP